MAFTGSTIWEVETGGSDTNNGGGFDISATFPTDGAATVATGNSPVFTSASYNFVAGDVGAWIYIKSGTNWTPGWYKIVSVAANAATLDATIGAAVTQYRNPNIVAGCATTASPTSATWGIDYSQGGSSRITFTDMVIGVTTTTFTSVANPVGKNFIGNTIKITSGTGFTVQRVYVVSTSTTIATCDKSLGTTASTGGNGRLGGALSSIGIASSLLLSSQSVFIQTGSYTITSATVSVTGGCLTGTGLNDNRIIGYSTVRGDMGTPPVLTASGISTFSVIALLGANSFCANLTIDGASLTSSRAINATSGDCRFYKIWAKNCTNGGLAGGNNIQASFSYCRASGCSTVAAIAAVFAYACEAYDNTIAGFGDAGSRAQYTNCISYGNIGAAVDGFDTSGVFNNCVAYGNGRDGFRRGNSLFFDCIAEGNTGYGFNITSGFSGMSHCAGYNNTSGNVNYAAVNNHFSESFVTGTASFFTNAAGDDFSLNDTAGGGAELRAAGKLGVFPDGISTGYYDIGAVQHADPVGAAGMLFIPDMAGT